MINSVEEAYQVIATNLVTKTDAGWSKLVFETKVLGKTCSAMVTTQFSSENQNITLGLGMSSAFSISDACIFLRDDLLKTTGQRIWGLIFILFPDGKFRIEYDYDKPEGYEETDETIEVNLNSGIS